MTEVHQSLSWLPKKLAGNTKEEYTNQDLGLAEDVPMIVIESNQVSAETDAPMIIVGNDLTEQVICAEEEVETEMDLWYSTPPIAHEETVDMQEEVRKVPDKRPGRVALPYLKEELSDFDVPLNDESYATYHPFPCDFCSRRFKKKANLMNHMVAHQTQRPHSCHICTSRFMRKCDLVNHLKIHSYVPNRENRGEFDDDPFSSKRKVNKKGKPSYAKRSAPKPKARHDSGSPQEYFKPTSYVDEDVKLLLEMTNRLHEKSGSSEEKTRMKMETTPSHAVTNDEKPYVCHTCGRCFARESALISHSQMHAEDSHYECNKCGTRFFTLDLLRNHSIRKHDTPYTGETSDSSDDNMDKRSYTGDERFGTFHCPFCPLNFHRLELLKQHKRQHSRRDESSSLAKCVTCGSTFPSHEKLMNHLESNTPCQRHVCLVCGEPCADQSGVQKHIQQRHLRDLPSNACSSCGKQCKDKKALQKHLWVHSSDKKYWCKRIDCMKKFHSWARLRRHMQSHNTSKVVQCEECDEKFPDRRALINHRHSHLDSTARKFVCNECGKSFGSRSSQQIHNRIHTGERPYGCRYCWKAFADGGTLRKHERIHTGEKPYVCVVCPRAFNQRVVLREHIRSHHSGSVTKAGYSTPVYECSVCGAITVDSDDLAIHLVKHSDDNTLKNRTPHLGIRSYNRRQKLSYDYDAENEFDDADFFEKKESESDLDEAISDEEESNKSKQMPRKRMGRPRKVDNFTKLNKTFEAAMKNISTMLEPKPVKKAKMINTKPKPNLKKTKKQATKVGARRRNVTTEVVVTRPRTRTLSGRLSGRKDSFSENTAPETDSRSKYRSSKYDAGFGEPMQEANKKNIRKPVAYQKKQNHPAVKTELIDPDELYTSRVEPEDGYKCGICTQVFPSKADLLSHVPVHI